jgi:branched-chain amino acid transport system substrate-binding protein
MRPARGAAVLGLAALAAVFALGRCSLLVGSFTECGPDLPPCGEGLVCEGRYCVAVPPGCQGVPDAGVVAAYGQPDAGNAIHFGLLTNLTNTQGAVSASRVQQLNAVVLALEEINQRGVAGRRFALHVCDTRGNTDLLKEQLAWMGDRLGVPAVIVPTSAAVVTAAPEAMARGVLLMSPTATAGEIAALNNPDGGIRLIWRTAPSDDLQATVISDLLLGASTYDAGLSSVQRVGVAYVNDPYGQGLSIGIQQQLAMMKDSVGAVDYPRGGNLDPSVSFLSATVRPELTVLVGFPDDVGRFITASSAFPNLRRDGGHRWFFTDSAKDSQIVTASPPGEVEGAYGTSPAQGAGPAYALFAPRFQFRFGTDPASFAFITHSYDAMYVLALGAAHAVGSTGTGPLTGSTIAEGLTRLSSGQQFLLEQTRFTGASDALLTNGTIDVQGTSGQLNFDPRTGQAPGAVELWQVDGGQIRAVAVIGQ